MLNSFADTQIQLAVSLVDNYESSSSCSITREYSLSPKYLPFLDHPREWVILSYFGVISDQNQARRCYDLQVNMSRSFRKEKLYHIRATIAARSRQ